jgi:SAM-dependent methyltransferase
LPLPAFDGLATDYDATFTDTVIGRTLRAVVWSHLDQTFHTSDRVLDLGCGTGEDAVRLACRGVHVVAVDSSPRMIETAQAKARRQGCAARIEFRCLPLEELSSALDGRRFDGVLSNFGAINCVRDLNALIAGTVACLEPGAALIWVVMGRCVPWEWAWYLRRGDLAKAWRRFKPGGVQWRGLTIFYPTPQRMRRLLSPYFRIEQIIPLGFALPPSYAGAWLERSPRTLKILIRLENMSQRYSALASWSDHYIVKAVRASASAVA